MIINLAKLLFWMSLLIGIMGMFTTFASRHIAAVWFICVIALAVPSVFVLGKRYKLSALLLIIVWVYLALAGYVIGGQ